MQRKRTSAICAECDDTIHDVPKHGIVIRIGVLLAVVALVSGCKKNDNQNLILEGKTSDSRNGTALSGVSVDLDQQVVEGGSLNSTFTYAGESATASDGSYHIEFERENALEYRADFSKEGFFDRRYELNPDDFRPGETVTLNTSLIPEATISIRLQNIYPESDEDEIRFRYLDANFDCECCNNDFIIVTGANADTTFECKMHGDYLIHYVYEILRSTDTTVVDSVFCPAFQMTEVHITY